MVYSSTDNPRIRDYKKLQTKKYRDEQNHFFIEGDHLVVEAYQTGYLEVLIVKEGLDCSLDVETIYVTDNVLKYLSEMETAPSMMGICKKKQVGDITGNVLLLEDIQDPGNLGTIMRSAVAFHMDTLILSRNTVDPYNQKVIRASQGLIFHLNVVVDDLPETVYLLKQRGYPIIGTQVTGGKKIETIEKKSRFAIIMGNEGSGMSEDLSSLCDTNVYIEMSGKCESLNVGVAASIILYEIDK